MLLDLPRVEYVDKEKPKVKKSDVEFVKEQNKILAEKRAKGEKADVSDIMSRIVKKKGAE